MIQGNLFPISGIDMRRAEQHRNKSAYNGNESQKNCDCDFAEIPGAHPVFMDSERNEMRFCRTHEQWKKEREKQA